MKSVLVFGSGGMAKEVIGYIETGTQYHVAGVVSSEPFNNPYFAKRYNVFDVAPQDAEYGYVLAIADPEIKRKVVAENADHWITYAHQSCFISPHAKIGKGCVFAPQSIVSGDPVIEDFVFFNTNATVGHDSIIRKYTTLFPNSEVCGDCDIGEGVIFGIGAYAFPKVNIAAGAKVSAGAVVRKSVLEAVTVYGDPAKPRIAA